jgi:hypothetical protein
MMFEILFSVHFRTYKDLQEPSGDICVTRVDDKSSVCSATHEPNADTSTACVPAKPH